MHNTNIQILDITTHIENYADDNTTYAIYNDIIELLKILYQKRAVFLIGLE